MLREWGLIAASSDDRDIITLPQTPGVLASLARCAYRYVVQGNTPITPDASLPMGQTDLPTIGIQEYVALPDWGIKHLRAKTDTGARTSAIDAYDIEELEGNRVRFIVVASRKHTDRRREIVAEITRRAPVKSSTGHQHDRLFVTTTLKVGSVEKKIEVSLVSRHKMKCRMLIGRTALAGSFLVDPEHDRLLTRRPVRRKSK